MSLLQVDWREQVPPVGTSPEPMALEGMDSWASWLPSPSWGRPGPSSLPSWSPPMDPSGASAALRVLLGDAVPAGGGRRWCGIWWCRPEGGEVRLCAALRSWVPPVFRGPLRRRIGAHLVPSWVDRRELPLAEVLEVMAS